jgi:hypothetical protein
MDSEKAIGPIGSSLQHHLAHGRGIWNGGYECLQSSRGLPANGLRALAYSAELDHSGFKRGGCLLRH